ncbi:MAG TPA: MFS transporter, partial [Myxococcaceae bacterium]|nr:MFS transporter [Myxococcaceae bacterium]
MSLPPAAVAATAAPGIRASYRALLVLTLINLVNYLDRYIIAAALPDIQRDFGINATQSGLLGTLFIVVFMVFSPLGGFLGDRYPRKVLVGGGVLLWSLATGASGLASS